MQVKSRLEVHSSLEPTGGCIPLMTGRAASWKAGTDGAVTTEIERWFHILIEQGRTRICMNLWWLLVLRILVGDHVC